MSTSRRTVLKAGAWSVPAVTLASAAPAFATSTEPEAYCTITGERWVGLPRLKTFIATVACTGAIPYRVTIDGHPAVPIGRGRWKALLGNSGRYQIVKVYDKKNNLIVESNVDFGAPPAGNPGKGKK